MLAGVTDCGRSRKWGCRGRWALGFKARCGSHTKRGPMALTEKGENHAALAEWGPWGFGKRESHMALGCSLLPCGLGSRRDFAWKKRGERTLAGGP